MRKGGKRFAEIDLRVVESVLCIDQLEGSTGAMVYNIHVIVKTGTRSMIESELRVYRQLKKLLKRNIDEVFPRIASTVNDSSKFASFFIEPIHGEVVEKNILKIGEMAKIFGVNDHRVVKQQEAVCEMTKKIFANLKILHLPIKMKKQETRVALRNFVCEMENALDENLRLADIDIYYPRFSNDERFWIKGGVSAAHRDLSVVNIIGDETAVRFIDPRLIVPNGKIKSEFASPAIDFAALSISFERKELEIQDMVPGLVLSARKLVEAEIHKMVDNNSISRDILMLSSATVRSAYAACRCSYCLAPDREWLYKHMVRTAVNNIKLLGGTENEKNSYG